MERCDCGKLLSCGLRKQRPFRSQAIRGLAGRERKRTGRVLESRRPAGRRSVHFHHARHSCRSPGRSYGSGRSRDRFSCRLRTADARRRGRRRARSFHRVRRSLAASAGGSPGYLSVRRLRRWFCEFADAGVRHRPELTRRERRGCGGTDSGLRLGSVALRIGEQAIPGQPQRQ